MRTLFWAIFAAGLMLAVVGLGAPPPMLEGMAGETLVGWYRTQAVWGIFLGAVLGSGSALLAARMIRHRPREESTSYLSRVRLWGVLTLATVLLLLAGFCFAVAYRYAEVPLAPADRGWTLLFSAKSLLVLGPGLAAAAVAFASVVLLTRWGGAYALIPPALLRPTARN